MSKEKNKKSRKLTPVMIVERVQRATRTKQEIIRPIAPNEANQKLASLITLVHHISKTQLNTKSIYNNKQLLNISAHEREQEALAQGKNDPPLKPAMQGYYAGIRVQEYIPPTFQAKSRIELLCLDHIVSKLKNWNGDYKNKPNAGYTINLGAVDAQMVEMRVDEKKNQVWVFVRAQDKDLGYSFNLPKIAKQATKICKPTVFLKPDGIIGWNFCFEYSRNLPSLSGDFVLGVDRGVTQFATWSIKSLSTGKRVTSGYLSDRLLALYGKIRRIEDEVRGISAKLEGMIGAIDFDLGLYDRLYEQLRGKRGKVSRLKGDFCKFAAREIVGVAGLFGNCLVMMEQLDWAGNWHGRVPFGLFKKWMEHYCELAGSHVQLVNAAGTSTECDSCGSHDHLFLGRDHLCRSCGELLDRDINASAVIAGRGIERAKKSHSTREKTKNTTTRTPITKSHYLELKNLQSRSG